MQLYALLILALLPFSFAELLPRWALEARQKQDLRPAYQRDYVIHVKVYKDLEAIPPKGPITGSEAAALQKDLGTLQKRLRVDIRVTTNHDPLNRKDSNDLVAILKQIGGKGIMIFDDIIQRRQAISKAGATQFACDNVIQACDGVAKFISAFVNISQPRAGKEAAALQPPLTKKCTQTTSALKCKTAS